VYRRPSRIPAVIVGALVAVVTLVVGIWLGGHPGVLPQPVRDAIVADEEAQLVDEALDTIDEIYYRRISRERLVNEGIEGAVASLDDQFSHYFDPKTYHEFEQSTDPSFSGIGVTVRPDPKGLVVVSVIDETPAARAGLRRGDRIVAVGAKRLAGRPSSYATGLIRGEPGTKVTLTLERDGTRMTERIERAEVTHPVVAARIVRRDGRRDGHVVFASFTERSSVQLRVAVQRMLDRGATGIVLDLRGNGGGLLSEAVDAASVFISDGTIVSTAGRSRPRHVYTATGGAIARSVPVVVLVDRGSASAAEIVAGALQDRDRARVVGTRTYGKGVFQEIRELSNGGALDLTVGQYFLPSGRNLGGKGVKEGSGIAPDLRAKDDPDTRRDEALEAALRALAE
jgi:carboxyl-terminal processing protease